MKFTEIESFKLKKTNIEFVNKTKQKTQTQMRTYEKPAPQKTPNAATANPSAPEMPRADQRAPSPQPLQLPNNPQPLPNLQARQQPAAQQPSVAKGVKRQILLQSKIAQKRHALKADTKAIFESKLSLRAMDKLRMRQCGEYVDHPPRRHTGKNHAHWYNYDTAVIIEELTKVADANGYLGRAMNGKWNALGRKAGLTSRTGSNLNAAQVIVLAD